MQMRRNVLRNDIHNGILSLKGGAIMAIKTANVIARVEPEVKEKAEQIMEQLGIPTSVLINVLYKQIIMQKGIPFEMKLPKEEPLVYSALTKEQFDKEIGKGIGDIKAGRVYSADAVEEEMKREFGT